MPEQVRCPSCNAALRVPEDLLGKDVRCPKCDTTFLAEMDEPAQPERIVREPAPRSYPRPPEEYEEDFLEEEEYPRRRRSGRRASDEAKSLVSGPATALQVVGILDIVLGVLSFVFNVGASILAMGGHQRVGNDGDLVANAFVGVFFGCGAIIFGSIITMGAVRMKQLKSYGLAMAACVLAMIPAVNCCLLGLPFGIWALTVLNKSEVKDAFV